VSIPGPVVVGVQGTELGPADRERLSHPLVGMVILFASNYESPAQLERLTADIHALRDPPLLVAVDHEGGRVQRFKRGFTRLLELSLGAEHHHQVRGRIQGHIDIPGLFSRRDGFDQVLPGGFQIAIRLV